MTDSNKKNIISLWFSWYFYEMLKFLLEIWKNYIFFALNYFSLADLLKSIFAPWRRYKWNYPRGFDLGEFFSTLISNLFSRILGALMRVILIIIGILFQVFVIFAGLIIFLLWLLIPFVAIAGLLFFLFY
jgi:hypothetical protein